MNDLRELSELAWKGSLDTKFEHHPVHTFYEGSTEINSFVLGIKGIGGFYAIDTGDGLVMLDAGSQLDIETGYQEIKKWRPNDFLKKVIFSHHHVDHVFAVQKSDEECKEKNLPLPKVYSHSLTPEHFDRYKKTQGWNTAINRRQFAIDSDKFSWPSSYRYPDEIYENECSFKQGNFTFNLYHARGETDDHTWVHIPEAKILAPGDLFIWAVPNGGNPQKVQRYISDWAEALDKMKEMESEILLPGHGFPIFGKERIKIALTTTSELLKSIEDQTLVLMNKGKRLNEILHEVRFSESLMNHPWLKPVYDDPQFLVRMVWRRYGGWWDGEYDRLLPSPREEEALAWVELSGGTDSIIKKALKFNKDKKHKLAAHLIETVFHADPKNKEIHKAREKIFKEFSLTQESSMARNILNHASLASRKLKRDLAESD